MANPIQKLHSLGQSLWYDNIQRRMLEDGTLAGLIRAGELRGMTSNPSIFNHAIAKSKDYDDPLKALAWSGYNAEEILDRLIIEDIRAAADLFLPLYESSGGGDGFVSVEVGPAMAHETEATLAEAHRLWDLANHPNVMVKIPATPEGIPAIRRAIADGLNINITLIFSIIRYREVMEAYLSGLEDRLGSGKPIDRIASVASFFVSRIDSKIDPQLEKIVQAEGPDAPKAAALLGKIAVANARLAYAEFRKIFESERFTKLAEHGARVQRPLWASTSTKNPAYPDTMYVDELIGPHTVNTVPQSTLDAFRDHGTARLTIEIGLDDARREFQELERLGISIDRATQELEDEGVKAFAEAFQALTTTVDQRRQEAANMLGPLHQAVTDRVTAFQSGSLSTRIRSIDPTVWTKDPAGKHEIRNRMGWLTLPEKSRDLLPEIRYFVDEIRQAGYTHALLLGMGGSSLAPEVLRLILGVAEGYLDLVVLDSTDPAQVQAAANHAPVEDTLFIVSSKSGSTAEIKAFLDYFWNRAVQVTGNHAAEHFIAITDPGTDLEQIADERGFRRTFHGEPKVGGRYSALSAFGLVPGGLLGADLERLLNRGRWMMGECSAELPAGRNLGMVLGAILGEAALHGRDKLTLIADPEIQPFGAWLEQLIAESSGKQSKGIIPIVGEVLAEPKDYQDDRIFFIFQKEDSDEAGKHGTLASNLIKAGFPVITYRWGDVYDLGAEFYRWEYAVAAACAVLGVNPFDQPDVQDAKTRTLQMIDAYHANHQLQEGDPRWEGDDVRVFGNAEGSDLERILEHFLNQALPGDYIAINAYLPRNPRQEEVLDELRRAVMLRTGLAITLGFGPRFLHSTGQLHKGGKNNGLFIEITADPAKDIEIPTEQMTFGLLEAAQAIGDFEALQARQRRVIRLQFNRLEGVEKFVQDMKSWSKIGAHEKTS